jgi:hypothetical protein
MDITGFVVIESSAGLVFLWNASAIRSYRSFCGVPVGDSTVVSLTGFLAVLSVNILARGTFLLRWA